MRARFSSDKPYHHKVAGREGDHGDNDEKGYELPGALTLHATTAIRGLLWRATR